MEAKNNAISRRGFLEQSGKTTAGLVALASVGSFVSPSKAAAGRVIGANDRINVAVVGIRGRGMALARGFAKVPNVFIKTLCDIDENLFASRVEEIGKLQGTPPASENDFHNVLADKDIDVVAIATPNHWHALMTILACQTGKHVYVEKPCCHNIFEGRKMVEAAAKYNRIVTVGLQSRSFPTNQQALKFLHEGGIGEIYMGRCVVFIPRDTIGHAPDGPCKGDGFEYFVQGKKGPCYDEQYLSKVNYDRWLGPAPKMPFNCNRFHYNWHWNWTFGNGEIGNNGPHCLDIARNGMQRSKHPHKIRSYGGYYAFQGDQQTPNYQTAIYEYDDGKILQCEVRNLFGNQEDGEEDGCFFYGTKGWLFISTANDGEWKSFLGRENNPGPFYKVKPEEELKTHDFVGAGKEYHFFNFIQCLRDGGKNNPCPVEEGFKSSSLPILANISFRLNREVIFDPDKEKFVKDKKADKMLTRDYRKPCIVPEKV